MRSFEEDKRIFYPAYFLKPSVSVFSERRDESEDREWVQRKSGCDRGGQGGAGTRHGVDGEAVVDAGPHELDSGVGNTRRTGVGYEGDALSRFEPREQLRNPDARVVVVETERWRGDTVMREEPRRAAGVFGGDNVGFAKHP